MTLKKILVNLSLFFTMCLGSMGHGADMAHPKDVQPLDPSIEGVWESDGYAGASVFQTALPPRNTNYSRTGIEFLKHDGKRVFNAYVYKSESNDTPVKSYVYRGCQWTPVDPPEGAWAQTPALQYVKIDCAPEAGDVSRVYALDRRKDGYVMHLGGSRQDSSYHGAYVRMQDTYLRYDIPQLQASVRLTVCVSLHPNCLRKNPDGSRRYLVEHGWALHNMPVAAQITFTSSRGLTQTLQTVLPRPPEEVLPNLALGRENILQLEKPEDIGISRVDINFDGHPDLLLNTCNGCAGYGGPTFDVYIFNPKVQQYVLHKALTELFSIQGTFDIDTQNKRIVIFQKSGCCWHSGETYKISRDAHAKITIYTRTEEGLTPDGKMKLTKITYSSDGKILSKKIKKYTIQ